MFQGIGILILWLLFIWFILDKLKRKHYEKFHTEPYRRGMYIDLWV